MKSLEPSESEIQRAYFQWVRMLAKQNPRYRLIKGDCNGAHFANGPRTAMFQKSMGMIPGWPDVEIPWLSKFFQGIVYIEFKTSKGKLSAIQEDIHALLRTNGHRVYVCREFESAQKLTEDLLACALIVP